MEVVVDLLSISIVFNKGHKLCIVFSLSNLFRFLVNWNNVLFFGEM